MSETLKFGNGIWATKKGSTLAYNSENGNFKPLPFTFDRSTSATRVNKEGLIEVVTNNEPRIDFLNDSKGALLLEKQSTNRFLYSEDFSNASWIKHASNYSNNTINADTGIAFKGISQAEATQGVQSVYFDVEYTDHQYLQIGLGTGGTDFGFINFDIQNKVLGTQSGAVVGSIVDYGSFIRIIADINTTSKTSIFLIFIDNINSSRAASSSSVGSFKIYRSQLEQGSYATSYIPTQGSIGTRVAESSVQVIPSDISLSTSGTVFLDYTLNINLTTSHFPFSIIDYNNGSSGEWITRGSFRFSILTNGNLEYAFQLLNGTLSSPTQVSNVFPNIGSRGKMAISWDGTNVTFSVNGVNYQDTLSANFTGSLDGIYLGQLGTFNNTHKEGKFNEVKLYNTRLTDQELINLTTI